jgi:hypothetical protein
MKYSISIIDSFGSQTFHEMFNSGLLAVCAHISDDIHYYAGKSAIHSIQNILYTDALQYVTFKYIPVLESWNKYLSPLKYAVSFLLNIVLLTIINKNNIIIFNYNNIFCTPFINTLNKILKKRLFIFCHGELELLSSKKLNTLGVFAKIIKQRLMKFILNKKTKISERLRFIVLGDHILENLHEILPENIRHKIYAMDHPYIFSDYKRTDSNHQTIHLGTIGGVVKGKDLADFISLVKNYSLKIKEDIVRFSVTGPISYNVEELKQADIDIPDNNFKNLSRENFNKRIAAIDYALFFYNTERYRFTASGAVFDAINFEKPIIAYKNNYFEYLFKKYGAFGILVDSLDEMSDVIENILSKKDQTRFSFNTIKQQLSVKMISCQLRMIFERLDFIGKFK